MMFENRPPQTPTKREIRCVVMWQFCEHYQVICPKVCHTTNLDMCLENFLDRMKGVFVAYIEVCKEM
jgi:hypothetical protein